MHERYKRRKPSSYPTTIYILFILKHQTESLGIICTHSSFPSILRAPHLPLLPLALTRRRRLCRRRPRREVVRLLLRPPTEIHRREVDHVRHLNILLADPSTIPRRTWRLSASRRHVSLRERRRRRSADRRHRVSRQEPHQLSGALAHAFDTVLAAARSRAARPSDQQFVLGVSRQLLRLCSRGWDNLRDAAGLVVACVRDGADARPHGAVLFNLLVDVHV